MAQVIGSAITGLTNFNLNTQMPSLSDNANIQEALRLYHYGAPSGTGVGQYDPSNTSAANLVNPSIAHSLYSLQTQISSVSGSLGVQASVWSAKGVLVSATAPSSVSALTVGTNGQVLTANSATATGLEWSTPEVTLVNTITLTNKTLTTPTITTPLLTLSTTVSTVDARIYWDTTNKVLNVGNGTVSLKITPDSVVGTLTNKTLTAPTISQLYLSDSVIIFEGSTADAFETTLGVIDPTADRTINLPNVSGTVITSGNLADITSVGTLSSLAVTGNAVSHIAFNTTPTGAYTLVLLDDGKVVEIPAAGTITVPSDATTNFPVGTQITILQTTAGQVTLAGATTPNVVTVNATPGLKLRAQWSSCTLIKRGVNVWVAMGDLTT
jgi:hypothetical protein